MAIKKEIRKKAHILLSKEAGQSSFQVSVVKLKPNQLLTNYTTQPNLRP